MASLQPLPGGASHFAELRARNELYVDKTAYIADMRDGYGKYCFLARPRRFGKSLLVSALECLFQGRAAFFRGTQMEGRTPQSPNWTWPDPAPVIRFRFCGALTLSKSRPRPDIESPGNDVRMGRSGVAMRCHSLSQPMPRSALQLAGQA